MKIASESINGVLCKYGNFGDARDQVKQNHLQSLFSKREIYFAQANELNDPFELRPRFRVSDSPDGLLVDTIAKKFIERSWATSLPEALVLAQSYHEAHPNRIRDSGIDDLLSGDLHKSLHENVGVLCLSPVQDSVIMFSHYGAAHTGFCLEFDGPRIAGQFSTPPPFDLEYGLDYPTINPLAGISSDTASLMWQKKFSDWAYEREVRIISERNTPMLDSQPSGPGAKVYRKGALRAVILGKNVSDDNISKVRGWLAQRDDGPIQLFREMIHASQFRLTRVAVNEI